MQGQTSLKMTKIITINTLGKTFFRKIVQLQANSLTKKRTDAGH